MRKRPAFRSVRVVVADEAYSVILRATPPRWPAHVSADHPRAGDVGAPARVQVMRIFRGAVDVGDELMPWTRRAVEEAAREAKE